MKKMKWPTRLLCALLTLLMLSCMVPAFAVSAEDGETGSGTVTEELKDHTKVTYESAEARLASMKKYYDNGKYSLYCDEEIAVVAYKDNATGEILFTNPWDVARKETSDVKNVRDEMMTQIVLTYIDSQSNPKTLTSYIDAIQKGQFSISPIKNGLRVDYIMGETSARILVPLRIEKKAFEEKIDKYMKANLSSRDYLVFRAYYSLKEHDKKGIAAAYPVTAKKEIDIYVYNDDITNIKTLRKIEKWILAYCPDYTFAEMDNDYAVVEFQQDATSPPVFRMSLEYTIDANGLVVSLPANGLRYDETTYRITDFQILPNMGASYKGNALVDGDTKYEGYSMIPDGSGALYDLTTETTRIARVYGEDYALQNDVSGYHVDPMRMPVFGQVEKEIKADGTVTSRGYFAIIEAGDTLASIQLDHSTKFYSAIKLSFVTRQSDKSSSGWTAYASRRYTDDYQIRYVMLTDDAKAAAAGRTSYYECSWMGMACAYRDYLSATQEGYKRLTAEEVGTSIPLYIETFGCMDTVKKILSVPVTVSVALTSFEDVQTMYEYLLGEKVENVNFRLTGYANGGLYSEMPYKLKWEGSVGGKGDFKDLVEYAAQNPGLGIFPDFDFVYTSSSQDSSFSMKKYATRTVDNRYTARRTYSATQQTLVSYFQMVMSPATFDYFYEELEERYADYGNKAISLSTFGSELNSDFGEEKTSLREDSKFYTMEALNYFASRDYSVMVDSGNAYTWGYVDHILNVPLDSNRYNNEKASIPFMGVVLHGYVQFAGSAFNMEGNLTYAMLKAMENGAGIYFVLSYANTELLKEDFLLSQNYSVRYDIWQKRLVEIYHELNAVLADVQTKLIIEHEFLQDKSSRIPDEDELLKDALEEADKIAQAVKDKIDRENAAIDGIDRVLHRIESYKAMMAAELTALKAQRSSTSALNLAMQAFKSEGTTAATIALKATVSEQIAARFARIVHANKELAELVVVAKTHYNYLVTSGAEQSKCDAARAKLVTVLDEYLAWVDAYNGAKTTAFAAGAKDAYINDVTVTELSALTIEVSGTDISLAETDYLKYYAGNDATTEATYAAMGIENMMAAFSLAINAEANSAEIAVNVQRMVNELYGALEVTPAPEEDDSTTTVVTPEKTEDNFSKYTVDSSVVRVTYGEPGTPYKTLILNFNDYAIRTEFGGVLYNISAYGYAIIYH